MTVVAIHQPNFLPYAGFFWKMDVADVFILYDTAQYSRNDYHNRCQIKTPHGPAWLTVPVRSASHRPIRDVEIDNKQRWAKKILTTLEANYARAPHFPDYAPALENVLLDGRWSHIASLNAKLLGLLQENLGIATKVVSASGLPPPTSSDPTGKIVDMVRAVNGTIYLSGPAGRSYLNTQLFRGIALQYSDFQPIPYPQLWGPFQPNLSVLDSLFNCGPDALTKSLGLRLGASGD